MAPPNGKPLLEASFCASCADNLTIFIGRPSEPMTEMTFGAGSLLDGAKDIIPPGTAECLYIHVLLVHSSFVLGAPCCCFSACGWVCFLC